MGVRPFSRFSRRGPPTSSTSFVEPSAVRTKIDHPVNLSIHKDFTDKSFVLKDLPNHHR